jgi:hypothetical protein
VSGLGFEPKTAGIHYRILVGLAATFDDCTGWCESVLTLCLAVRRLYMMCLVKMASRVIRHNVSV